MPMDARNEQPGRDDKDFGATDVAVLMAQVQLQRSQDEVTVRGVVQALRPDKFAPAMVYGDLRGFDEQSTMSFKCPLADGPSVSEHAILRGRLNLSYSTFHRRLDLQLVGHRVGSWVPGKPGISLFTPPDRDRAKLSLERFLSDGPVKRIVLIGTRTAIGDAKTTLSRESKQLCDVRETTTGLDSLLAAIADSASKFDGLCFIRGGGNPDSFTAWNDGRLIAALVQCGKPFYTALGHASDFTLADKYADESFANPSDFASSCKGAWIARQNREKEQHALAQANQEIQKLKAASQNAKSTQFDRSLDLLKNAVEALQRTPATLGRQMAQSIGAEMNTAIQKDFSRTISTAMHGPVAELQQATDQTRSVMAKWERFQGWPTLLVIFFVGAVLGAAGCFVGVSKIEDARSRTASLQQQGAAPVSATPAPGTGRKKLRFKAEQAN